MSLQLFDLFPTPVARVAGVLGAADASSLARRLSARAAQANERSAQLAHSDLLGPGDDAALDELVPRLGPHVQAFGAQLFGEPLRWRVKEIWANVLRRGGHQAVHNHANSFVSGIVYLTPSDESARTVFLKSMGGADFSFRHAREGLAPTAYGAEKWRAPPPQAGDLLLFPSYLLHEVPVNEGADRMTLAFNAIPERLDAWGYSVTFGA